jgi:hypothetical protein
MLEEIIVPNTEEFMENIRNSIENNKNVLFQKNAYIFRKKRRS